MIRYNGKYYKLIHYGQLIMVSRSKTKCYEKLFTFISYAQRVCGVVVVTQITTKQITYFSIHNKYDK